MSLCDEHYCEDPSGIVAETYESLQHRVRRPFPRTRGGSFRPNATSGGTVGGGGRRGSSGQGRGSGGRSGSRGRGGGGGGGRGGRKPSSGGGAAGDTIAQRRPKRGQVAATAAAVAAAPKDGEGCSGGGGSGGDKRSRCGGGLGDGVGLTESNFVCVGCKMAARRAVRQYGLLGSLETGGVVLPYGESDVSRWRWGGGSGWGGCGGGGGNNEFP